MNARVSEIAKATVIFLALAGNVSAAVITVTDTGDTIAVDGKVTLREAIISANNNSNVNADVVAAGTYGVDTINFNIPGPGVKTINVTSALPSITGPTTINGYSQPGASLNTLANGDNAVLLIELNGANAGAGTPKIGIPGLTLASGSANSLIEGLVINRFSGDGILIKSSGNGIFGNFIGTNPSGTAAGPGNANTVFDIVNPVRAGIFIDNVGSNDIGGGSSKSRNIISGNVLDNIHILGNVSATTLNKVLGNFIGVGADGKTILNPTSVGGIEMGGVNASGNVVGGTTATARNIIGGNHDGIELDDGTHDNTIQGNFCGVASDGVIAAGNRGFGIAIRDLGGSPGLKGNAIGGTGAGSGNVIANNGSDGVAIFSDPGASAQNNNNPILGNSIFNNGNGSDIRLGIDLVTLNFPSVDAHTPNDFGDADAGPNNLQNYPMLTGARVANGITEIDFSFNSRNNNGAGQTYRLEFFNSPFASASGFGEGQTFVGAVQATLNAHPGELSDQGHATLNATATFTFTPPAGSFFTATATELAANSTPLSTSEFSNAVPAFPTPTPAPPPPPPKLANISTRALVQTGDNALFGGFIAVGNGPVRVVVLGVGPSLQIPGALADPTMELHDSNGVLVDTNDNWVDSPDKQEIMAAGLAPGNNLESAIVRTVNAPESFTVIVRGVAGATGIAVVQVFALN
ncbi:MAG: beta strand repeat-containing protein [Chthoniobacterales bacterium]